MSIDDYKNSIKTLVDATTNEALLKHWKEQLERDLQKEQEVEFTQSEWQLVQEGLADYQNGAVISLEEFLKKR
ncbi:MAG TPA: hypothetical protein VER36_07935 [Flavisolibacter sp.]|nr:hypothetical protein [Flavisolibacter sp.]